MAWQLADACVPVSMRALCLDDVCSVLQGGQNKARVAVQSAPLNTSSALQI